MLAYLAARPDGRASREELAALIWGERAEEQARASLRQELSLLRKALPEAAIEADRHSVRLAAEHVHQEPPAPGAQLLEGLSLRGEVVQHWLRDVRAADNATRRAAHLAAAKTALAEGDAAQACTEAKAAQLLDMFDETALRLLMQA